MVYFLPNTPQHHLKNDEFKVYNREITLTTKTKLNVTNILFLNSIKSILLLQQAEKALMFYKGCNKNNEREKTLLKVEFERMRDLENDRRANSKIGIKDICNRMAFKGIITSIAISWFMQSTGAVLIMNYASLIFEKSGTALSIDASGIILAVIQIVGSLVSTQLGDTFGRKTTLFISLSGSAVGLFVFTVYSYLRQNGYDVSSYLWLPVVCLSFVIFIASSGIVALANTCTVENFPPKVKSSISFV